MSIFSEYKEFSYIYPPRPETAIQADHLAEIGDDWIAQPKYNGSCAMVFIDGHKSYKIYNRHAEELTLQRPLDYIQLNDSDRYMVLCGEYLNKNKKSESGNSFNHKFIIWDILVWKGVYLVGMTMQERITILHTLFGTNRMFVTSDGITMFNHLHFTHIDNIFMAPSYLSDFKLLYDEITQTDLYEGLILKKTTGRLQIGFKESNNSSWQVKIRKKTQNYNF